MSHQNHWLLPEGIEEVLPEEARGIESLRRDVVDLFAGWGYQLVIPPFIDFLESLLSGTGHELDLQTFKVTDQISGRLLGIRADMTPQVARIDAHNIKHDFPTRLCYLGTVLHTLGNHLEKSRSPMQVGAELYGHGGLGSDLEILRLMLEMLAIAGIKDVHLDLGHVGIYRSLAKKANFDPIQESQLFDVLQRKSKPELIDLLASFDLSDSLRSMFMSLVDLNGPSGIIDRARSDLSLADPAVMDAISDLESIATKLFSDYPSLPINFDLAELRGYHYQTGIVFAAFAPGYGREITRGGRYNEIGKKFGRARPATGFSADLKVIARLSSMRNLEKARQDVIFAPDHPDPDLEEKIRELRVSGQIVVQELAGQIGHAVDMGCRYKLEKKEHDWQIVSI